MGTISEAKMREIADKIRPHVDPIIETQRELTIGHVKLACRMEGHQIVSERTLNMILSIICEG